MNKDETKAFEKNLLEKRQALLRSSSRDSATVDLSPEYGRDEGDRAVASQAKEMAWLQNSQERGLRELIESALSRIQSGTFGECLHCGQQIGLKRLTAIPWTRYCIACQELLEQHGT
ncbi:MAG TPA: TraR/DksA family transcriptional regulator [Candidatus Angelobacter sp.]|nr:TraR/DksA family transcriptional regulator [Candidatus Angelobacter sp.]